MYLKDWGRRPRKFQCSLHHYKSSVHLFNFIGASRAVRAVHNNKTASFLLCSRARGAAAALCNFCYLLPHAATAGGLAHWADWQVNKKQNNHLWSRSFSKEDKPPLCMYIAREEAEGRGFLWGKARQGRWCLLHITSKRLIHVYLWDWNFTWKWTSVKLKLLLLSLDVRVPSIKINIVQWNWDLNSARSRFMMASFPIMEI